MRKSDRIPEILRRLRKAYGRPAPLKRSDPVDELIRTVLSQNTSDANSLGAFSALKRAFHRWVDVLAATDTQVASVIRHGGLAAIKAARIRNILAEIKRRQGALSLSFLEDIKPDEALEYLKAFKGVGPKTAVCVLLFSFGKPVMPVDTHIFRVTKRLGLIDKDSTVEEAHGRLSEIVPKRLIYEFHLGIIEHGRRTCKARAPLCGACVLYGLCRFESKGKYR